MLTITAIDVVGDGFALLEGPELPITLPGDGTFFPFYLRCSPDLQGVAKGSVTIITQSAPDATRPLMASVNEPVTGDPISEVFSLAEGKTLFFESTEGSFELQGGDKVQLEWTEGVISVNGKKYLPGPTREEYLIWKGPHTRQGLSIYQNVPFIVNRVGTYGDNDSGWDRAFVEWETTTNSWVRQVSEYYVGHPTPEACRQHLLSMDTLGIIESVAVDELGLMVKYEGTSFPIYIELPPRPSPPPARTHIPRDEAVDTISSLRWLLESAGSNRVELKFGSLSNIPERILRAKRSK